MKLRYKKRVTRLNLIFGSLWFVFALIQIYLIQDEDNNGLHYLWLILSVLYFSMYFYQNTYQYLTIENGVIRENGFYGKSLNLAEVCQIKEIAGDYILKTDAAEMNINTQVMDPESLKYLEVELQHLNVEVE